MSVIKKMLEAGELDAIKNALAQDPDIAVKADPLGTTPLHEVSEDGNHEIALSLIQAGAKVEAKDHNEHTPLFKACWFLNWKVMDVLLRAGADENCCDASGHTPLHWAAFQGNPEMVDRLLKEGADPEVADKEGRTPLDFAMQRGNHRVREILQMYLQQARIKRKQASLKTKNIEEAIDKGELEEVRTHLDIICTKRNTPEVNPSYLHLAIYKGHPEIVDYLLSRKVDVNYQGNYGVTALHLAAETGDKKIMRALLRHGAIIDANDFENKTPMMIAKLNGHLACLKMLNDYAHEGYAQH
jgi:ankyrin repeat protein